KRYFKPDPAGTFRFTTSAKSGLKYRLVHILGNLSAAYSGNYVHRPRRGNSTPRVMIDRTAHPLLNNGIIRNAFTQSWSSALRLPHSSQTCASNSGSYLLSLPVVGAPWRGGARFHFPSRR